MANRSRVEKALRELTQMIGYEEYLRLKKEAHEKSRQAKKWLRSLGLSDDDIFLLVNHMALLTCYSCHRKFYGRYEKNMFKYLCPKCTNPTIWEMRRKLKTL